LHPVDELEPVGMANIQLSSIRPPDCALDRRCQGGNHDRCLDHSESRICVMAATARRSVPHQSVLGIAIVYETAEPFYEWTPRRKAYGE
jgi:hypothetical protein